MLVQSIGCSGQKGHYNGGVAGTSDGILTATAATSVRSSWFMAKKSDAKPTAEAPRHREKAKTGFTGFTGLEKPADNNPENPVHSVSNLRVSASPRLKSSALVEIGVGNEGQGRRQDVPAVHSDTPAPKMPETIWRQFLVLRQGDDSSSGLNGAHNPAKIVGKAVLRPNFRKCRNNDKVEWSKRDS